jgi:hypothetical protein
MFSGRELNQSINHFFSARIPSNNLQFLRTIDDELFCWRLGVDREYCDFNPGGVSAGGVSEAPCSLNNILKTVTSK